MNLNLISELRLRFREYLQIPVIQCWLKNFISTGNSFPRSSPDNGPVNISASILKGLINVTSDLNIFSQESCRKTLRSSGLTGRFLTNGNPSIIGAAFKRFGIGLPIGTVVQPLSSAYAFGRSDPETAFAQGITLLLLGPGEF